MKLPVVIEATARAQRAEAQVRASAPASNQLNARGFRTESYTSRREKHHTGGLFGYTKTHSLLQNKVYIAVREINMKNKRRNPESHPESQRYRGVPAIWSPISDRETFDRVQRLLTANTLSARNVAKEVRHVYVFNGGLPQFESRLLARPRNE